MCVIEFDKSDKANWKILNINMNICKDNFRYDLQIKERFFSCGLQNLNYSEGNIVMRSWMTRGFDVIEQALLGYWPAATSVVLGSSKSNLL